MCVSCAFAYCFFNTIILLSGAQHPHYFIIMNNKYRDNADEGEDSNKPFSTLHGATTIGLPNSKKTNKNEKNNKKQKTHKNNFENENNDELHEGVSDEQAQPTEREKRKEEKRKRKAAEQEVQRLQLNLLLLAQRTNNANSEITSDSSPSKETSDFSPKSSSSPGSAFASNVLVTNHLPSAPNHSSSSNLSALSQQQDDDSDEKEGSLAPAPQLALTEIMKMNVPDNIKWTLVSALTAQNKVSSGPLGSAGTISGVAGSSSSASNETTASAVSTRPVANVASIELTSSAPSFSFTSP